MLCVWRAACVDVVARLTTSTSTSTSTITTCALVAQHQRRHATSTGNGTKDDDDDVETSDDYEKMMAMEDSYGSGVMQEEKSGRAETPGEKRQRIALDLERRGVLVGDRVRVAVRVGAPLPERAKKTREGVASEMVRRETMATPSTSSVSNNINNINGASTSAPKQRRWMTRAVTGYVVCVRNGRVGVKRTGLADSDEWFPTYPQSWVTVLDVGEMWEMNTGPRNLAGASDDDMYEYQKATGQLKDNDQDVK